MRSSIATDWSTRRNRALPSKDFSRGLVAASYLREYCVN